MNDVFLGLGTNIGNRERNLDDAISRIDHSIGIVVKTSSVYETEPWGFITKDQFLNMVVEVNTKLTPSGVMAAIEVLEKLAGRTRNKKKYSSRVIDIDILLYKSLIIDEPGLNIPHPLMHERKFVLVPLCEIAPDVVHPVLKLSFASLLETCEDRGKVKKSGYGINTPFIDPTMGGKLTGPE